MMPTAPLLASRGARTGFTLIELLVVIAIIAILVGILVPGLIYLRKLQREAANRSLVNNITLAIDTYFETWPLLGDRSTCTADSSEFETLYYQYLFTRAEDRREGPFISLPNDRVARLDTGTEYIDTEYVQQGEVIRDYHGQPIEIEVFNDMTRGYTRHVRVISVMGSPSDRSDDICMGMWTTIDTSAGDPPVGEGVWVPLQWDDAQADYVFQDD